jgi:hypothetical protein
MHKKVTQTKLLRPPRLHRLRPSIPCLGAFRPLSLGDGGLIDLVTAVDMPHTTPGNANVYAFTAEFGPVFAIPAVQWLITGSEAYSDDVIAITTRAVDGFQTTWNWIPLVLVRQHAIDCPTRVDMPLLEVGANSNMGSRATKPVRGTFPELPQFILLVNVDGTIISPGINLEGGKQG